MLEAFRRQIAKEGVDIHAFAAGPRNDEQELLGSEWDAEDSYIDDVRGGALDTKEVEQARAVEMDWISARKVFTAVPIEQARKENAKILDMKWIDAKKSAGIVRSRLVVREIKARKKVSEQLDPATVFAAMPPVGSLKALVSHMQTEQRNSKGERLELMVIDISRAHFYGISRRKVYTTLPEGYEEPGKCALLLKSMYGTEDAASIWQDT